MMLNITKGPVIAVEIDVGKIYWFVSATGLRAAIRKLGLFLKCDLSLSNHYVDS